MGLFDYNPGDFAVTIESPTPTVTDLPAPVVGHYASHGSAVPFEGPEAFVGQVSDTVAISSFSETALINPLTPENADREAAAKFYFDSAQLDKCIVQAENLRDMLHSDDMALKVVGILSYGLRRSGELLADAIYRYKMAKTDRKRAEAVAALDNFGSFMADRKAAGQDIKATDSVRTHYIALDPGVLKASEREAFHEALVSQLDTYKMQFTMSMSAVKAMIAKQRGDEMISGVATPMQGDT